MGLFDKEKEVSTKKFRQAIEKDTGRIPRTGWRKFNWRERKKLGREAFPRAGSQGSKVQSWEFKRSLKKMDRQRKELRKQASASAKKGDMLGARKLKKQALGLRGKMQVLGRVGGGRWGKRVLRRKNW